MASTTRSYDASKDTPTTAEVPNMQGQVPGLVHREKVSTPIAPTKHDRNRNEYSSDDIAVDSDGTCFDSDHGIQSHRSDSFGQYDAEADVLMVKASAAIVERRGAAVSRQLHRALVRSFQSQSTAVVSKDTSLPAPHSNPEAISFEEISSHLARRMQELLAWDGELARKELSLSEIEESLRTLRVLSPAVDPQKTYRTWFNLHTRRMEEASRVHSKAKELCERELELNQLFNTVSVKATELDVLENSLRHREEDIQKRDDILGTAEMAVRVIEDHLRDREAHVEEKERFQDEKETLLKQREAAIQHKESELGQSAALQETTSTVLRHREETLSVAEAAASEREEKLASREQEARQRSQVVQQQQQVLSQGLITYQNDLSALRRREDVIRSTEVELVEQASSQAATDASLCQREKNVSIRERATSEQEALLLTRSSELEHWADALRQNEESLTTALDEHKNSISKLESHRKAVVHREMEVNTIAASQNAAIAALSQREDAVFIRERETSEREEAVLNQDLSLRNRAQALDSQQMILSEAQAAHEVKDCALQTRQVSIQQQDEDLTEKIRSHEVAVQSLSRREDQVLRQEQAILHREQALTTKGNALTEKEESLTQREKANSSQKGNKLKTREEAIRKAEEELEKVPMREASSESNELHDLQDRPDPTESILEEKSE
ncbi:hypothetical protein VNI00_011141 [Paramarasmius palmivorus]|uniref:Uncharacterized protein n=1 Tax=Paramarasmius palmivorus TaxID=297713 RepID=A0AAW0CFT8_9AGAR